MGSLLGTWLAVTAERSLGRFPLVISVALGADRRAVPGVDDTPSGFGASMALTGVNVVLERDHRLPAPADHPDACSAG